MATRQDQVHPTRCASPVAASVADVQAALGADEALALFLDTPEQKPLPEETFLWVVTKTDVQWLRSDLGTAALAREVAALRCGPGLQQKIDGMHGHSVVVLHMMGSHGPAYYKRYPATFERFQPACKESQFSRCERSEIINSYDNTIVYTDYVLSRAGEGAVGQPAWSDAAAPRDRRASVRHHQGVDGSDALQDENPRACRDRDGAARARLQHQARDRDPRCAQAD